jgi:hypothetical protein
MAEAPAAAIVLADWHWATPLWYLQEVEGRRPDLEIHYVFPTAEPYAESWRRRIAEGLAAGRPVVATHFDELAYSELPPAEPLGEAFLFTYQPRLALPAGFQPLSLPLGDAVEIVGYRLDAPTVALGQEMALTLAWRPLADLAAPLSLFVHLVAADGRLVALDNVSARPRPEGLSLTRLHLTPGPAAAPGQFAVMAGAQLAEPLLAEDGQPRTAIADLTVLPLAHPPLTLHPLYRQVVDDPAGRRLVGYDWDQTQPEQPRLYLHWQTDRGYYSQVVDGPAAPSFELGPWRGPWALPIDLDWPLPPGPQDASSHYVPLGQGIVWTGVSGWRERTYAPGESVAVAATLRAGRPVSRDLVVSIRLVGFQPGDQLWAWWDLADGVPALGAIPTLKWMPGAAIRDPHFLTVDPAAYPGQRLAATLRLYDAFTGRPVPILDERLAQLAPYLPLGATTVAAGLPN